MDTISSTNADQLRQWAKGMYGCEAATELLIRTGWASPGLPWVEPDGWIDAAKIVPNIGAYSGGEQRFLRIVASLYGAEPVDLEDAISGIDRELVALVLAALAHASGSHEHSDFQMNGDGTGSIVKLSTLHAWPTI